MEKIGISIYTDVLEKFEETGKQEAIHVMGEEDWKDNPSLDFWNESFDIDEMYWEDDRLHFNGTVKKGNHDLAYLSFEMNLPFEIVVTIIESYRKKLGKIKTVLKAIK